MKHLLMLLMGCIVLGAFWTFVVFITIIPIGFIVGAIGGIVAYFIGFLVYHLWIKRKT